MATPSSLKLDTCSMGTPHIAKAGVGGVFPLEMSKYFALDLFK